MFNPGDRVKAIYNYSQQGMKFKGKRGTVLYSNLNTTRVRWDEPVYFSGSNKKAHYDWTVKDIILKHCDDPEDIKIQKIANLRKQLREEVK